jgi:hypothetical protein
MPPSSDRRARGVLLLLGLLLLLAAGVFASRQLAVPERPTERETQAAPQATEDCEEEPPPTSFTLAECDADEPADAELPSPAPRQP